MPVTSIHDLPAELLRHTSSYLGVSDIKNLRLVSPNFNVAASPYLFSRIYISSHSLDLYVFRKVTAQPLFRNSIRELVWDDSTFNRHLMSWDAYCVAMKTTYRSIWCGRPEIKPSRSTFDLWLQIASEHHVIREARLDEKALIKALPHLPSLKRIVLTKSRNENKSRLPLWNMSPTNRYWESVQALGFPTPVVDWWTWKHWNGKRYDGKWWAAEHITEQNCHRLFDLDFIDEGLTSAEVQVQMGDRSSPGHAFHPTTRPFRGLLILIRALAAADIRIPELMIRLPEESTPNNGMTHWLFRHWNRDLERFEEVVRHLRVLHLNISKSWAEESDTDDASDGHVRRILHVAKDLEELNLVLWNIHIFKALDPNFTYPNMKSVFFESGVCTLNELLTFLQNHRSTLRYVVLKKIWLEGSTWKEMMEMMKGRGLRYTKFCLHNSSSSEEGYGEDQSRSDHAVDEYLNSEGEYPLDKINLNEY